MSQVILRVGKKGAIYLPKRIMEELGIEPGDVLILKITEGNKAVLEFIPDPLTLAIKSRKWTEITVEEFEKESEEEQRELYG